MMLLRTYNLSIPLYAIARQIDEGGSFNYTILNDHEKRNIELNGSNLSNIVSVLKNMTFIRKEVEKGKQVYFNMNGYINFKISKESKYYFIDNWEILLNYIILDFMDNSDELTIIISCEKEKYKNNIKVNNSNFNNFFLANMKDETFDKILKVIEKIKSKMDKADSIEIRNEKESFVFYLVQYN